MVSHTSKHVRFLGSLSIYFSGADRRSIQVGQVVDNGRAEARKTGGRIAHPQRGWALFRMDIFAIRGTGGLWPVTLGPLAYNFTTDRYHTQVHRDE